jgi:cobalt-zinc-cadmium efflux system outer membrane protein
MRKNHRKVLLLVFPLFVVSLCSCAAPPVANTLSPDPRPLGRDLAVYQAPHDPENATAEMTDEEDATGVIVLRQALALALMRNPELAAFSWEVRAKEAEIIQVGLLPNPEVGAQLEEFAGSGERRGLDTAQSTLQIGQTILLGGKREKRVRLSVLERDLAGWDYEAKRLDVLTEVTKAFVDVLAAQEQVALSGELVGVASGVLESAAERVKAGKVPPLAETKASVELTNARIGLETSRKILAAARKRLSNLWGQAGAAFTRAEGSLADIGPIPSLDRIERLIAQNPDVARWVKEMEQRSAALELEKANAVPDVSVSAGWQRFNDNDDNAAIVGISIPLPLFNRNQGAILDAKRRQAKAKQESRAAEANAHTAMADSYQSLASSFVTATEIRDQVLPSAQLAFQTAQEGYREGKFDFLEVLDAERTLFETRGKFIVTLADYHKARADVERLIGERLEDLK